MSIRFLFVKFQMQTTQWRVSNLCKFAQKRMTCTFVLRKFALKTKMVDSVCFFNKPFTFAFLCTFHYNKCLIFEWGEVLKRQIFVWLLIFLHLHEIVEGLYFYFSLSVCLSLCMCVSVCLSVCEQNADRTATPILTRSSLNSCLLQSLKPYWNWWPSVKGQGHSDVISTFPSYVRSKWNKVCRLDIPLLKKIN